MSSLFSSFGRALKMIVNRPRYPLQPQKKKFILFFLHTENLNRKSGIIPCFLSQQYTWAPDNIKGLYSAASLTLPALSWEQVHQARGCFFGRVILCAVSEKHLFHIYTLSSSYVSRHLFFFPWEYSQKQETQVFTRKTISQSPSVITFTKWKSAWVCSESSILCSIIL